MVWVEVMMPCPACGLTHRICYTQEQVPAMEVHTFSCPNNGRRVVYETGAVAEDTSCPQESIIDPPLLNAYNVVRLESFSTFVPSLN